MNSSLGAYAISFASRNGESLKLGCALASWFTSRGRPSALVNISSSRDLVSMRSASKLLKHIEYMDDEALKGYLKVQDRNLFALAASADELTSTAVERLCRCFAPLIFAHSLAAPSLYISGVHDVPLIYVMGADRADEVDAARRASDVILSARSSVVPSAFLTSGMSCDEAARVSRSIGAAWWGEAADLDSIATRAMDSSGVVRIRRECRRDKSADVASEVCAHDDVNSPDAPALGPLSRVMADPDVTEIMVNGFKEVFVERKGRIEKCGVSFRDDEHLKCVIERAVASVGRRIDESSPMVDARLPDGSRLNAVIRPLAVDHPLLTVRRFMKKMTQLTDLVASGMLTHESANYLSECVRARASILISGGTGAGKTTLLNVIASCVGEVERVITIEDAAELNLSAAHVVRLEARTANVEGKGEVSIRDLVRNALRMRPDRIVVGECRGAETIDMLQAMNTGHEGSLTTVHANSPRDALMRIETMVLFAGGNLPLSAIREQVARAIKVIIQVARVGGGERRVVEISEVTGMEGGVISLQTMMKLSDSTRALESTGLSSRYLRGAARTRPE